MQEFGPRVAPAFATVDEHVATAEAVLEPLQHAQGVGAAVDRPVRTDHESPPGARHHVQGGLGEVGLALVLPARPGRSARASAAGRLACPGT